MLDLLPLSLDRELKDLVIFYKCLYCSTDLEVLNYLSFVSHGRTRQSNSFNLRNPLCKTSTFQASYFKRIVKLWNLVCKLQQVAKIVETLHPLGALLIYLLSLTLQFCNLL